MPRRLKNLVVTEVSGVDSGAGRGVRVVLMKRDDGGGDVTFFSKTYGDRWALPADSDAALLLAEHADELDITVESSAIDQPEDRIMTGVNKALEDMDKRVRGILKRGGARSREGAIAVIAGSSDPADQAIWQGYKKAAAGGLEVVSEPPSASTGEAYAELQKRARKLQKRQPGLSDSSAFAAVYGAVENREIVEAYKADFEAQGVTVVKAEPAAPILSAFEIDRRERAEFVAKSAASGAELRERARQNNFRALRAMYPGWPDSRVARLARQQAEGGIDLTQVAESLGYRGGP